MNLPLTASGTAPYSGSQLFNVATYSAMIYPGAAYTMTTQNNVENPPLVRPFPADPTTPGSVSQFVLGASAWVAAFPPIVSSTLAIQPHGATSFGAGVSAQASIGNAGSYQNAAAVQQADGTWLATLSLAQNTTTSVRLVPVSGTEATPYAWIDTGRYFTPAAGAMAFFTTEGVFGICSLGATTFADPPGL